MQAAGALSLLVCSLVLIACGGSADSARDGESRAEIRRMLIASAKSDDPDDCRRYSTQRALEQIWREEGRRAVELCEEEVDAPGPEVRSVDVSEIAVDGERATAQVGFEGGPSDGQVVEVAVVEEKGEWKVDELRRFVVLDRVKALATFAREWREEAELPTMLEIGECVLGRLAEVGDEQLERFLLHADAAEIERFALDCVRQSESDRAI